MSKPYTESIKCPSCKHEFDFTGWESLNTTLDPDEKERLLSGELFRAVCPKCQESYNVVYPILYHDMERKVMVWLILKDSDVDDIMAFLKDAKSNEFFEDMIKKDGYTYRFVKTQDELREKALIFDCGLDDRVVEYLKIIFHAQLIEQNPELEVTNIYFYNEPTYCFLFYLEDGRSCSIEFDEGILNSIFERKQKQFDEKSKDIMIIDNAWAIQFFQS